jgi:hypothetical protein
MQKIFIAGSNTAPPAAPPLADSQSQRFSELFHVCWLAARVRAGKLRHRNTQFNAVSLPGADLGEFVFIASALC